MQFVKAVLFVAISIFWPGASSANDLHFLMTRLVFQSVLNDHGYDVGTPDGKIGPATRAGLAAFAKDYRAPNDVEGAIDFMVRRSLTARKAIVDPEVIDKVEKAVADGLRDPSSIMIRNVYKVRKADEEIICGEVNGKNAYGGYAGFVPFYGMWTMDFFLLLKIEDTQAPIVGNICSMAFPRRK